MKTNQEVSLKEMIREVEFFIDEVFSAMSSDDDNEWYDELVAEDIKLAFRGKEVSIPNNADSISLLEVFLGELMELDLDEGVMSRNK